MVLISILINIPKFISLNTDIQIKIRKRNMEEISSPFLSNIFALKSKSRNTRKKIYKYLQSRQHPKYHQENRTNIHEILKAKPVLTEVMANLEKTQMPNLKFLDKATFQKGVDLQKMRNIVNQQEKEISVILNHDTPFRTAQKRKPLADLTQYQSADNKRLLLTRENQQSGGLSLEGDFCSDVSIFKGLDDIQLPKSQEESQFPKLKENCSLLQLENRCSIISNSLFEDPIHAGTLQFLE